MNHYETLGVPSDASQDDIKRAYRRAARKAHPDHGGTEEEMAAVNRANDVLGDPLKRLRYDHHGDQAQAPEEDRGRKLLAHIFSELLENPDVVDIVAHTREVLKKIKAGAEANRTGAQRRRVKLQRRRDRVKCSGSLNLVHLLIDQQLARLDADELERVETLAAQAEAMTLLEAYVSTEAEQEKQPGAQYGSTTHSLLASLMGDMQFYGPAGPWR